MFRIIIAAGAVTGVSAVAMAAVAAHGLSARLEPEALQSVRNAVQMQGWHALALLSCGVWAQRGAPALVGWAAAAFTSGLLLFCGSVYLLELATRRLPYGPPAGGLLLMAGWILLGIAALRA